MVLQDYNICGYTLRHLLGIGGMAEVWLAENKIGKKAAVKVLSSKLCDDETIMARFENEAKIMVKLEHPNIRQVYDYATVKGRPCIIMEYLEGYDLKKMMKDGHQFSNKELGIWWNQMVQALNYTHKMGVVHRDIKPSNIFIDNYGNVKLLDFGIAKNTDSAANTMTGVTLGTLLYMSPEQVKDPKHIDYKSDLYSLAVTFVHLITGKAPYDSSTNSNFEIQLNIVKNPLCLDFVPPTWRRFLEPYLDKSPRNRPELMELNEDMFTKTILRHPQTNSIYAFDSNENSNPYFTIYDPTDPKGISNQFISDLKDNSNPYFTIDAPPETIVDKDRNDLVIKIGETSFVMKKVNGGIFQMGATQEQEANASEDEKPVHTVRLSDYYIGETPVTQTQWFAVMKQDSMSFFKGGDRPVDSIMKGGLFDFIFRLNTITNMAFRLPTEAEWEFAARGGRYSNGYKYAGSNMLSHVAWFEENSGGKTHPVRQKAPNELGIYDMCGNVLEWCADIYDKYDGTFQENPRVIEIDTGLHSNVARGGCYYFGNKLCRTSCRFTDTETVMLNWFGFRLALSF